MSINSDLKLSVLSERGSLRPLRYLVVRVLGFRAQGWFGAREDAKKVKKVLGLFSPAPADFLSDHDFALILLG